MISDRKLLFLYLEYVSIKFYYMYDMQIMAQYIVCHVILHIRCRQKGTLGYEYG